MTVPLQKLLVPTSLSLPFILQSVIHLVESVHQHPDGMPLSIQLVPLVTTDPQQSQANGRLLHRDTTTSELNSLRVETYPFGTSYILMRGDKEPVSPTPTVTFLHELGHYLDHSLHHLNAPYASVCNFSALSVSIAAARSNLIKDKSSQLSRHSLDPKISEAEKQKFQHGINHDHQGNELFACAYAQWIITRSNDSKGIKELNTLRSKQWMNRRYWDDDDFKPIGAQLDELKSASGL